MMGVQRSSRGIRRRVLVMAAAGALTAAAASQSYAENWANDCVDICGSGTGACTIGVTWDIVPGSTIDCSGRDLTVTVGGNLKVTDGSYSLLANNLVVNGSGGTLTAVEGAAFRPGEVRVAVTGNFTLAGKIRANGSRGGGRIFVDVGGSMTIPDSGTDGIEALGTSTQASGGTIDVTVGGSLSIYDPILADSGASGPVSGGSIRIKAGGDIVTSVNGHISAYGRAQGGGEIEVISEFGDVVLHEHLKAEGLGTGADGGTIAVVAGDFLHVGAEISVMGGVNVNGGAANGGSVSLLSGCGGTAIAASINATGGQLGGSDLDAGSVSIDSKGSIAVSSGKTIDNRALQSGGRGGPVRLAARDLIDLQGTAKIDSRGSTASPGAGGDVQLTSCRTLIASGATVDVSGATGGSISVRATKDPPVTNGSQPQPLTVGSASVLRAAGGTADENGRIELSPLHFKYGECTNNPSKECELDSDCTAGCETGECNYANPDTAGLNSQFDLVPSRQEEADVGECEAICE